MDICRKIAAKPFSGAMPCTFEQSKRQAKNNQYREKGCFMNFLKVKEALRKVMVNSTGIDPLTQMRQQGMIFDPQTLPLWVEEFSPGGDISAYTNMRHASEAFIMQYNFNVPLDSSLKEAETKANAFIEELSANPQIPCENIDCRVRSAKYTISEGKTYNSVMTVITLFVSAVDKNFISETQ